MYLGASVHTCYNSAFFLQLVNKDKVSKNSESYAWCRKSTAGDEMNISRLNHGTESKAPASQHRYKSLFPSHPGIQDMITSHTS